MNLNLQFWVQLQNFNVIFLWYQVYTGYFKILYSHFRWVYLEPIFGAGTLSQDQVRFQRVDQDFRYIMGDVAQDNKVVSLCKISNLHQILNVLLDQLSRCQKSLNDFLEVCMSLILTSCNYVFFNFIVASIFSQNCCQSVKIRYKQNHFIIAVLLSSANVWFVWISLLFAL